MIPTENVENSRMARLGGEFAILMPVSFPTEQLSDLDQAIKDWIADLEEAGHRLNVDVKVAVSK